MRVEEEVEVDDDFCDPGNNKVSTGYFVSFLLIPISCIFKEQEKEKKLGPCLCHNI